MKKTFKIVGFLLALILVAALVFVLTFDVNNYKQDIVSQVEQQTGRKFSIDGNVRLTIFPWIGLKVEKVTLGNAKGFSQLPFAKIGQLEVKVQLLPLFTKELRVDRVRLNALVASLEVDAAGNNNWSDLLQPSSKHPGKSSSQPARPKSGSVSNNNDGVALAGLAVNGIELVGAAISWSDAQSGAKAKISDLTLKTSVIEFDEPVAIEFSAGVVSQRPDIVAKIAMQTEVKFNQALNIFDVEAFRLSVVTSLKTISQTPIALKLNSDAHIDLKQGTAQLSNTQLSTLGATVKAGFNVTGLNTQPTIKGVVASSVINGRDLAEKLQIELPPMAKPQSLTKISLNSRIQANATSLQLDDLKLTLDDSMLSGWVHILDILQPKLRYKLKLNPIVLDGYLSPDTVAAAKDKKTKKAVSGEVSGEKVATLDMPIPLPVELLRTIDLDGVLEIDRVTMKGTHLNHISIPARSAHGIMVINPVDMKIFEGTIRAKIGLDVRAVPAYVVDMKGNNLKAGTILDPILAGMVGDENVTLQGTTQFDVSIKTSGTSVLALKKSATGKIQVDMNETIINGIDVEHYVHNAVADYAEDKKLPFFEDVRTEYSPKQKTAYDRFHASFIVAKGKLTNKDLILESKQANVTGSGVIDIVAESIDYRPVLDIKVENPVSKTDQLKDIPVEFHVHGPFSVLEYEFNKKKYFSAAENIFKKEARAKIKKKVEAVKQEEKKKIEQKVKDKLKDLFRR